MTAGQAEEVEAPLIRDCHANFECRLYDGSRINKYNFFIFEVAKAHVASSPKHPETPHYRGNGDFIISGRSLSLGKKFNLEP